MTCDFVSEYNLLKRSTVGYRSEYVYDHVALIKLLMPALQSQKGYFHEKYEIQKHRAMSVIDYGQTAEDHQSLLVLVKHTGLTLSQQKFRKIWERIQKLSSVGIPGQKRNAWVRYKQNYPKENNDWGDYQAHRKALGLISVGECSTNEEFEELFESYRNVKEDYANTLFNSRLIVFGMNRNGTPLSEETEDDETKSDRVSPGRADSEDSGVTSDISPSENVTEPYKPALTETKSDPSSSSTKNSEGKITFMSKKPVKKQESSPLFQSSPISTPPGTPVFRRPHSNSFTKDSTGAEVIFFPSILDSQDLEEKLKEFVVSLFFVLEGKRLDRSFERHDRIQLLCAPFERKDYIGLDTDTKSFRKKCQGRLRKHLADLCLQAGIPGEAILHYETAIDILRPVNDTLWIGACYEGLASAAVVINYPKSVALSGLRRNVYSLSAKRGSSMLNEAKLRTGSLNNKTNGSYGTESVPENLSKVAPDPTDIIEKYREALINYSKFKGAAVIEIELSLKACRVLTMQGKHLQASSFLQNVIYINYNVSEEDKILRYCTLSELYSDIGFHRKAAFFKRIAAMQCVSSPQATQQNWGQCYNLLVQVLEGYNIHHSPKDKHIGSDTGWPVLQSRVLNELIFSARKMGKIPLAIRHTTFMIQSLHQFLSLSERKDICRTLEQLTAQSDGNCQSLALDNGMILPPVPFTSIPYVKSFKLIRLRPHLEPVKLKKLGESASNTGPFIFTPLNLGKQRDTEDEGMMDFCLVARDLCEVQLQVYNPLPDELKVNQMGLMVEGVEIEPYPCNPSIPAETGPYLVKLLWRPKTAGDLDITGYFTSVMGVKSHCKLKDLPQINLEKITVKVIPQLPQVQLTTSLPKADNFLSGNDSEYVVTSGTTTLFAGQRSIDLKDLLPRKPSNTEFLTQMFEWSMENIQSQLPLQPNSVMCFTLCINGVSDFMSHTANHETAEPQCVECLLRIEYSGGPGLQDSYCRQCAVNLSVDICPSVIIQAWDAIPAERPDHCYLVFDLLNASDTDLSVQHSTQSSTHILPGHTERIAVEIERCEFPSLPDNVHLRNHVRQGPIANHYSTYLNQFVDIRWQMPSLKTGGKVSIDHIEWSEEQLNQIQISPIVWEVKLNGAFFPLKESLDLSVMDCLDVVARVTINEGMLYFIINTLTYTCISLKFIHRSIAFYETVKDGQDLLINPSFLIHCEGKYTVDIKCIVISSAEENPEQTFHYHPVQLDVTP
ncbi:trafficking protein particle complex subunit 9-like [Saccostrea cucullata]|uniref:trafficking protein particle complex subunit 9-like n=1 Tax=Saccostrea cuccullata TaxID=36930 RepID=UPI002ED233F3